MSRSQLAANCMEQSIQHCLDNPSVPMERDQRHRIGDFSSWEDEGQRAKVAQVFQTRYKQKGFAAWTGIQRGDAVSILRVLQDLTGQRLSPFHTEASFSPLDLKSCVQKD